MENIKHSLELYVEHKLPTGGFLEAVLSNDLFGAFGKADDFNKRIMNEIVLYVYNEIPSTCWGSKEKVEAWLKSK